MPYLVSELLQGETLRETLRRGAVPLRKAMDYAMQIANGLAAAHEKGIVHRDLKPENLFLTRDGRVKILDFGLAKLTQSGAVSNDDRTFTQHDGTDPGQGDGHRRLHVSRAGAWGSSGPSCRPVRPGGRPVRNAHWHAGLSQAHRR